MFEPGVGVVGGLDLAVNRVVAIDPDQLADAELGALLIDLERVQSRLEAARARLTGVWDARLAWAPDGARSGAGWLAWRCRTPIGVERTAVRLARQLRTMPATAAAFSAGTIGRHHVAALAAVRRPSTEEAFGRDEAKLVEHATVLDWQRFTRVLAYWLQAADPDGVEPDAQAQRDARYLHLSRVGDCWRLDGYLDPVAGTIVNEALERVSEELFRSEWADHHDLARISRPAQRRADALVEVCRRGTATQRRSRKPRPLVSVFCGEDTFRRMCELADGTVISPGTVAADLDAADIERVVWDGPSRILDLGAQRRFVGAARRALELRDRGCTEPGCDQPARRCEGDHIQDWAQDGATHPDNGRLRCWKHHHRPTKPRGP